MNRGIYIAFMFLVVSLSGFQLLPYPTLAFAVFIVVFFNFYRALDTHIPVLEITACIASLQWLVGPVIGYMFGSNIERYEMYVESDQYFSYALPATCVYLAGLRVLPEDLFQHEYLRSVRNLLFFKRGVALLIISLVAQVASGSAPGGLQFFFFLLSQLRYVGAIYFLFSGHQWRYPLIAVSLGTLLISSAESAMFHDMIIWMSLIACYWYHTVKWNGPKKAMFFACGFVFVFTIQLIKADYRAKVWGGQEASLIATAYEKIVVKQDFINPESLRAAGMRINQGWIISAVMRHVPIAEPYAEGSTIKEAVISSLFPRFILKNKAQAGGQENFTRFTGLYLEAGTSMGISILGEGYANYGTFGGSIFMFLWGLSYAGIYRFAVQFARKYATFLFWLPLIFYQAIKAETELVVVLNQLIKGSVVAFAAYYGINMLIPDQDSENEALEEDESAEELDENLNDKSPSGGKDRHPSERAL